MNDFDDWTAVGQRAQAHADAEESRRLKKIAEEAESSERDALNTAEATKRTFAVLQEIMGRCNEIVSKFNEVITYPDLRLRVLQETEEPPLLQSFIVRQGHGPYSIRLFVNGRDEIKIDLQHSLNPRPGQLVSYHVNEQSQLHKSCGTQFFSPYEIASYACEHLIKAPLVP